MAAHRGARDLHVFLEGIPIGVVVRSRRGRAHFAYHASYPMSAMPLSLSLPIGSHTRSDIAAWIDGLLPDSPQTRSRWARDLGAHSAEPFDLLATRAGLECAGAVQFHSEPVLPDLGTSGLVPLTESEIATRLQTISLDPEHSDTADSDSEGAQFGDVQSGSFKGLSLSLAGAQPKIGLRHTTDDNWFLPTGMEPTTHILKPQRGHLNVAVRDSIAVNEHLCQMAAAALGLEAARTSLTMFADEVCLVTERFDRPIERYKPRRIHFEDLCQALGFAPALKYRSDGGPTPEAAIRLLRMAASRDAQRKFFLAGYFNRLIGNTDAHAKNYGVLLGEAAAPARLSPLYDLSSAAPYAQPDEYPLREAMRFADEHPATVAGWARCAEQLRVNVSRDELEAMLAALPHAFDKAVEQCPPWASDTAQHISESVLAHAASAGAG